VNPAKRRAIIIIIAVLALVIGVLAWPHKPVIEGRVVFQGTPPREIPIQFDAASARLRPNGLTTRHYVVSSKGGLANVFVWIKSGLSNETWQPAREAAVIEFRGAQFEPYVVAVRTNQVVTFRNGDPMLHNVHCTPRAPGSREFNFAMPTMTLIEPWYKSLYRRMFTRRPAPPAGNDRRLGVAERFVRVKCNVHPWEFAYICVIDHPFFAITDADGGFRFPDVPPGRYVIEAVHLKAGAVTQEVVIGHGEKKRLEFTFARPASGQ
jgi:hypothetical protein